MQFIFFYTGETPSVSNHLRAKIGEEEFASKTHDSHAPFSYDFLRFSLFTPQISS